MKKLLVVVFTCLILCTLSLSCFAAKELPDVGDVVGSYVVVDRNYEKLFDADSIVFEHIKTGALVMYLANDDIERSFNIAFKTPALDSKGIPHIFEHITLSGSAKYPSQSIMFPLFFQTYNTFINAMTFNNFTIYLVSSLSEEQLLLLGDYFLSGVFEPLIYSEERLFNREGWRYELVSEDAPLTITGTVYNEMRGNQQISSDSYYNLIRTIYPDSIIGNNSGGDPEYIPDLTYQEVIDFHMAYYHPSNALVYLYGDIDYVSFLELCDEYFSRYEKKDIHIEDGKVDPIYHSVEKVYEFPVEKNSSTDGMTIIQYAFGITNPSADDITGLQLLCEILNKESSLLKQNIKANLPGASVSVGVIFDVPQPIITFQCQGVAEEDKYLFKKIVNDSIVGILKAGIDQEVVDAIIRQEKLSTLTMSESNNLGVNLAMTNALIWTNYDTLTYFNDFMNALEMIEREIDNNYFERLLSKYVLNNWHRVLVVTVPVPGLMEDKMAELDAKLAAVKASMSRDEILGLTNFTQDLAKWSQEEPPKEMLRSLQAVDVNSLPEETKDYYIQDVMKDGIRLVTAEAAVGEIGITTVLFDVSAVDFDEIHYLYLYNSLMGYVSTSEHPIAELNTLITKYTSGIEVGIGSLDEEEFKPRMRVNWMNLTSDYEEVIGLVHDIVFHTDVTKIDEIKSIVNQLKISYRYMINTSPYSISMYRAYATYHDEYKYRAYMFGFEYYDFLVALEKELEESPETFVAKMKSVQSKIANTNGAIAMFAGNTESIEVFYEEIGELFSGIGYSEIPAVDLSKFPTPANSEALVVDSTVQYNMLYASLEELGLEYNGKFLALQTLIEDMYLVPQVRHGIGAYGCFALIDEDGIILFSYRDPGIVATYETYGNLGDFIRAMQLTQEDVDNYIINAYSIYAMPTGELTGAISALGNHVEGKVASDEKLKIMKELKSLTVADVIAMADIFDKMYEIGAISTSGGAAIIESNSYLFENIIYISTASTSTEPLTKAEVVSLLFDNAGNALEMAKVYGLLMADENGNYNENDFITRQEFAFMMARAIGIPSSGNMPNIADLAEVSDAFMMEVAAMIEYGLMNVDQNNRFLPNEYVSMSEYDAFITKLMYLMSE